MAASPLQRSLRLYHAVALVVGTILGASIFVQPSEVTGQVPTLWGTALVWLTAGVVTFLGALVCAELASALPHAGGVYVYLKEAFSPALGFLWGWAMFWTMHSGILAAIALVFARYLGYFVELDGTGTKAVAVLAILFLTAVNVAGVRWGGTLQTFFTAGKLVAVVAIVFVGFVFGARPDTTDTAPVALPEVSVSAFLLAVSAGLFAFGGWHMVTYSAEETVDAERSIPRALMVGVAIVVGCYLALNAVYFYVLPLATVVSSTRVAADAADAVLGFGGGAAMSALVAFSAFGALAGIVLAGPRVYYAMARDGLLFDYLAAVHPRLRTPHRSLLLQGLWASVLVMTGSYRLLFQRVVYTEWIFFGLMAIGLLVLRRRSGYERRYSMWGYPLTPLLFAAASFAVVVNHVVTDPRESLKGLGFVAIGLPVYYIWSRKNLSKEKEKEP